MIVRVVAIALTGLACAALWFGYMNLNIFRGTPMFDFRYVIFAVASFLGLSAFEWVAGWIKAKLQEPDTDH
jgi:hypothetical protein